MDLLAGRPRRVIRRSGRHAERLKLAAYTVVRLQRLAKMGKCPRVMSLYRQGKQTAATYGVEVNGVGSKAVHRLRRWAASAARPVAARRSLTAISLAIGDLAGEAATAAVQRLAKEVWCAMARGPHALAL